VAVLIRFEPSGRSIRVPVGTSLIEAIDQVGLPVARACGSDGVCCRCGVNVLEGREELQDESQQEIELKERNRIDQGLRLACRVRVEAPMVVRARYW